MPFAALRAVQTVVLTAILVPCAYMTEPVQSSRDFPAVVTALDGGRNAPHWQKCPECGNRVARSHVYKHLCRQDGRVDNRKRSKPTPALSAGTCYLIHDSRSGDGTDICACPQLQIQQGTTVHQKAHLQRNCEYILFCSCWSCACSCHEVLLDSMWTCQHMHTLIL